ncbi:hypothetical protein D5086_030883 [Populus alba]|uniref:Uncharacterized protein n=1 Tax=Populus alba TaxID=43335 RepID=A0ACC4APS1_POPAL
MFCCPRATKGCDDANGTFFVTTLTFSVLPRSIGAEVENIESNVHLSGQVNRNIMLKSDTVFGTSRGFRWRLEEVLDGCNESLRRRI